MGCYSIHDIADLIFGVFILMWYYYNRKIGRNIWIALIAGLIFILTSLFYNFLAEYIVDILEFSGSVLFLFLFARFFEETITGGNIIKEAVGVLVIAFLLFLFAYMKGVQGAYTLVQAVILTWIGLKLFRNIERFDMGDRAILSLIITFSVSSGVSRILDLLILSDFFYFGAVFLLLLSISEKMYISMPRPSNFFKR